MLDKIMQVICNFVEITVNNNNNTYKLCQFANGSNLIVSGRTKNEIEVSAYLQLENLQ